MVAQSIENVRGLRQVNLPQVLISIRGWGRKMGKKVESSKLKAQR
jgi:hypothetical protein